MKKRKDMSDAQEIKAERQKRRRFRGVQVPVCGGVACVPSQAAIRNAQRAYT